MHMHLRFESVALVALVVFGLGIGLRPAAAQGTPPVAAGASTPSMASAIPADEDRLVGDHLQLRTNTIGFVPVAGTTGAAAAGAALCAPMGSRVAVTGETGRELVVRFLSITSDDDMLLDARDRAALADCPLAQRVNSHTAYRIARDTLIAADHKRTGVAFGALMVPFKYRLGGAKELVSSSTVAPFVGFRTGWLQSFGLTFTPVVAAGLSLVPVTDATTQTTVTRTAYTAAVGLRLSSNKNEAFSAGLVYGRDFLNRADRGADPNVRAPWVSFYLGYSN